MTFSDFGEKLTSRSGILELMDDLGRPLPDGVKAYQMGGGNPARVPAVEKLWRERMEEILDNGDEFENLISHYDAPQGRMEFVSQVASYFRLVYGWNITEENIAVTNGSQNSMFYLFNLFAGKSGKSQKKILFPLMPEYIGYADQAIEKDAFVSLPSKFEYYDDHTFKYFVDLDEVEKYLNTHPEIGAICVSRPTNPSGNVLTDDEVLALSALAKQHEIPLIIDNAYGHPFPAIIFTEGSSLFWNEDIVLSMSLSKIGLPSIRTGIVIARKEIASAISNMNAIIALASASMGQALAGPLIESGLLTSAAQREVTPYYLQKAKNAETWIREDFEGTDYYFHKIEGSLFIWLYLPSLTITSLEFYKLLKERGVITVPSEYFFFGDAKAHSHYDKCLRLNYSGEAETVREALGIISKLYKSL